MLAKSDDWKNLIAEDVSLTGPLAQVQGKDAFIEINQPFFGSIQQSELLRIVTVNNLVITQITTGVETPACKVVRLEVSEWYEIVDHKIKSLRVYFDTASLLK